MEVTKKHGQSLLIPINIMESKENVNRTTSVPISVLRYDVDKGLNLVPEFNIYPSLRSQIKVGRKNLTIYFVFVVVAKMFKCQSLLLQCEILEKLVTSIPCTSSPSWTSARQPTKNVHPSLYYVHGVTFGDSGYCIDLSLRSDNDNLFLITNFFWKFFCRSTENISDLMF